MNCSALFRGEINNYITITDYIKLMRHKDRQFSLLITSLYKIFFISHMDF